MSENINYQFLLIDIWSTNSCPGFRGWLECQSTDDQFGNSWTETTSSSTLRPGTGWLVRTTRAALAVSTPKICSSRRFLWEDGNMILRRGGGTLLLLLLLVFGRRILWSGWRVRIIWEINFRTCSGELTELVTLLQTWYRSEWIFWIKKTSAAYFDPHAIYFQF